MDNRDVVCEIGMSVLGTCPVRSAEDRGIDGGVPGAVNQRRDAWLIDGVEAQPDLVVDHRQETVRRGDDERRCNSVPVQKRW